jgi:hypothetical protein
MQKSRLRFCAKWGNFFDHPVVYQWNLGVIIPTSKVTGCIRNIQQLTSKLQFTRNIDRVKWLRWPKGEPNVDLLLN